MVVFPNRSTRTPGVSSAIMAVAIGFATMLGMGASAVVNAEYDLRAKKLSYGSGEM